MKLYGNADNYFQICLNDGKFKSILKVSPVESIF